MPPKSDALPFGSLPVYVDAAVPLCDQQGEPLASVYIPGHGIHVHPDRWELFLEKFGRRHNELNAEPRT